MKGRIVTVTTDDNYILQGIYCEATAQRSNQTCVVHIHGSYGNFYENFFLSPMADSYNAAGISFLSINTRGRDYYADIKSRSMNKYESRRIGGIRELFQDCELDISAWRDFAVSTGNSTIVVQGHSLGAMKAAYFAWKQPGTYAGIVLLSPPDNFGLQRKDAGEHYDEYLTLAKRLSATDADTLMPAKAYEDPISAASYFALFAHPEDSGMFTYGDIELMKRSAIGHLACPMFITFAENGEAIVHDIQTCIQAISAVSPAPERIECKVIQGANHSYHFREELLASALSTWVTSTFE